MASLIPHPLQSVHDFLCQKAFPGPLVVIQESVLDQKLETVDPPIYYRTYGFTSESNTIVIYSGGNLSQLDDSAEECMRIANYFDCHVIAYEYPKYRVAASPTDTEVFATIREVYNFVSKDHEHVILWGRSVGGAPTCFLASQPDVKYEAVVIQSTFTSALNWGVPWFPFYMFIDILRNIDRIKQFRKDKPVFLFHWEGDEIIPAIHSYDLRNECVAQHIPCSLTVFPGHGHNYNMDLSLMFPLGLEDLYNIRKKSTAEQPS